ncbi:MAG: hypothetical protein ACETWK_11685 [Candidatus Aminicenantaceae bacterium]
MSKKTLSVIGVIILLFVLQNCAQKPEEGILKKYFHAVSLKDVQTMSSMALEPITLDVVSWKIVNVREEKVEPAVLPELNQREQESKKALEGHVGPTVEADDALYAAKEKLSSARTRAARSAAQREVDAAQAKFDEEREIHRQLQKTYNEAKAEAAREEDISSFSIGPGEFPNIRDMEGNVQSKEVEVEIEIKAGLKKYNFCLRRYTLRDESIGRDYRGRWIIVSSELIS